MVSFFALPNDILIQVITKLSPKDLHVLQLLCKDAMYKITTLLLYRAKKRQTFLKTILNKIKEDQDSHLPNVDPCYKFSDLELLIEFSKQPGYNGTYQQRYQKRKPLTMGRCDYILYTSLLGFTLCKKPCLTGKDVCQQHVHPIYDYDAPEKTKQYLDDFLIDM